MDPAPSTAPPPTVGLRDLFAGFLLIGVSGFGGVLPWARRMIVEERRWLTPAEFTDVLSLCQLLPGPNVVNVAVCVGARYQRAAGAAVAVAGLMAAPLVIVLLLAWIYDGWGHLPLVAGAMRGVAAAAAGLIAGMGLKMAVPHWRKPLSLLFGGLTFVASGLFQFKLLWILLALAPLSVIAAWMADGGRQA